MRLRSTADGQIHENAFREQRAYVGDSLPASTTSKTPLRTGRVVARTPPATNGPRIGAGPRFER